MVLGFLGFLGSLGLVFGLYFGHLGYGGHSCGEGRNFGETAKEEASSSSGAATLSVSAVTLEGPPGLSVPKAKPKAQAKLARALCSCRPLFLANLVWGTLSELMG